VATTTAYFPYRNLYNLTVTLAPGISNKQILEIYNAGRNKIRLTPGMKICHVVLQECRGTAKYAGAWKDQEL
jgi:dCTP deaminase